MKQYLTDEPDLAPYREMILHKNTEWLLGLSSDKPTAESNDGTMLVRIAEIEVHLQYLDEYLAAAKVIQQQSLAEEPGVLCLFPTQLKEDDGEHQS